MYELILSYSIFIYNELGHYTDSFLDGIQKYITQSKLPRNYDKYLYQVYKWYHYHRILIIVILIIIILVLEKFFYLFYFLFRRSEKIRWNIQTFYGLILTLIILVYHC